MKKQGNHYAPPTDSKYAQSAAGEKAALVSSCHSSSSRLSPSYSISLTKSCQIRRRCSSSCIFMCAVRVKTVQTAIGLQKDHPNMPSEDNTDTAYPSQTSVFPYPMLHRKIMTLPDFPLPGSKSFSNPLSELRSRSKMTKYHLQCKLHLRYLPRNPSIVSPTPGNAISVSMPEQMYPANRQTRCGAGLFAAA